MSQHEFNLFVLIQTLESNFCTTLECECFKEKSRNHQYPIGLIDNLTTSAQYSRLSCSQDIYDGGQHQAENSKMLPHCPEEKAESNLSQSSDELERGAVSSQNVLIHHIFIYNNTYRVLMQFNSAQVNKNDVEEFYFITQQSLFTY